LCGSLGKIKLSATVRRFFFAGRTRKEKANKKKRGKRVSPVATGDKGCAPLTAVAFWKKRRKNFPPNSPRSQRKFIDGANWGRGPSASRLVTSKVSPRGTNATLIIKTFPRVGCTLAFLKKSGVGQYNKSIWLKGFAGEFEGVLSQKHPLI